MNNMQKKLHASAEFKVGKHSIGWINSSFEEQFSDMVFHLKELPTFQKLPRAMNDAEIESELKPGFCKLGDILSFLDNAPPECKDGYANIFYTTSFVVGVGWDSDAGAWYVHTWDRGGSRWRTDGRVFSPTTESSDTKDLVLEPSETLTLEKAIEVVKDAGYKIFKEI